MTKEDYFKYYIQGSEHYLIPKDIFIELFEEMSNWREEAKELKKQLEEKENIACDWKDSCLENAGKIEELENQQKEFIEYINEKIDICDGFIDTVRSDLEEISYGGRITGKTYITNEIMKNEVAKKILEEILSKYKEIIGKDINVTTKGEDK